jgi:hypothetical protein
MFFEWIDNYLLKLEAAKEAKELQAKEKALKDDGYVFVCTSDSFSCSSEEYALRVNGWYGCFIYAALPGRIYAHKLRLKEYVDCAVRSQDIRRIGNALTLPIRAVLGEDVYNSVMSLYKDMRRKEWEEKQ